MFFNVHTSLEKLKQMENEPEVQKNNRALRTVKDYIAIAENLDEIASEKNDTLRNKKINDLTRGAGAEGGFSSGDTSEMAIKLLVGRIELLAKSYEIASSRSKLDSLVECFNAGDPCLSGRTNSLVTWVAKEEGLDLNNIPDPSEKLYFPIAVFDELFYDFLELGGLKKKNFTDFVTFVDKHRAPLKEAFSSFAQIKSEVIQVKLKQFEEVLVSKEFVESGQPIDWDEVIEKLVNGTAEQKGVLVSIFADLVSGYE
jgi:hypothetical protein